MNPGEIHELPNHEARDVREALEAALEAHAEEPFSDVIVVFRRRYDKSEVVNYFQSGIHHMVFLGMLEFCATVATDYVRLDRED